MSSAVSFPSLNPFFSLWRVQEKVMRKAMKGLLRARMKDPQRGLHGGSKEMGEKWSKCISRNVILLQRRAF